MISQATASSSPVPLREPKLKQTGPDEVATLNNLERANLVVAGRFPQTSVREILSHKSDENQTQENQLLSLLAYNMEIDGIMCQSINQSNVKLT